MVIQNINACFIELYRIMKQYIYHVDKKQTIHTKFVIN